ncbi:MFS transporter [Novosphingobium sp. B 225]|uniref:MFS transporter n=1 Tax=Novosphingobium sp. B 225 TaxID=1961849 RepID=UPI000B4A8498|nr:MFS transporter [Novosphingobium sp. B 225]
MDGEKKATLAVVALIVFIDSLGVGLILPVMPRLIGEITHSGLGQAAEFGGLLLFSYAAMQFLFAPVIGGLSDRFGRRPVLLVTLFLLGIDYLVMAAAPTLGWLFAGRLLSGLMGATWAAANSCVADMIEDDNRGGAFGMLGGAGAAGFLLGPVVGGLAGEYGTRVPFLCAGALALIGSLLGLFLLKETLPPDRRRQFDPRRANPLGSILQMARTPFVLKCLVVVFFMQLSAQAQFSIWAYWGELRFGWTPAISGLTVALYGFMLGLFQAMLTGKAIARYGAVQTARWSLLLGLPSYALLAFAGSTATVLAAIVVGAATGMTFPALQALMTARTQRDAQGELQGAIASTVSLTSIIGPVLMTQIFARFSDRTGLYLPGAPYVLSFALLSVAIVILWRTLRSSAR